MAAPDKELKRIWKLYTDFKLWTRSPDATSKRFMVERDSFEDKSLLENRNQTASSIQVSSALIVGLIYPTSDSFLKHGLRVEIGVPSNYPHTPPTICMLSKIHHPNIDEKGIICSARLNKNIHWQKLTLAEVVMLITELMDTPELGYVVNTERASLYASEKKKYDETLTEMVRSNGIPPT